MYLWTILVLDSAVALFYVSLSVLVFYVEEIFLWKKYSSISSSTESDTSLFLHLSQTSFKVISHNLSFYQGLIRHYRPELLERIEQFKQKQQKKATAWWFRPCQMCGFEWTGTSSVNLYKLNRKLSLCYWCVNNDTEKQVMK